MPRTADKGQGCPIVAKPIQDGHTVMVPCKGCGEAHAEALLTSRGYCHDCVLLAAIEDDHPGGLKAYQRQEAYKAEAWGGEYIRNATRKVSVGNGYGPRHYLNMTPRRLRDIFGPKDEEDARSPSRTARQESVVVTIAEQFAGVTITQTVRNRFTVKEAEAVDLLLERRWPISKIARENHVTRRAIQDRLRSALDKIHGKGTTISMTDDELDAVSDQVVAAL